jgi:peptidyl-prolyl cis-trans isomerase C
MFLKLLLSVTCVASLYASTPTSKVYATVNGEDITNEDIVIALRDPRVDFESLPKNSQDTIINQLVDKKLLEKRALAAGVEKKEQFKIALEKIKKDLALELWMQDQYKAIKIGKSEIRKFYEDNKEKFKVGKQLKARHILLADEKKAEEVISKISTAKDKLAKFIELAKSESTGPTGSNGGDLGWFDERRMVPEFSAAASKLTKGTFSKKAVKTQFGYHVIWLEDKKSESVTPLKDVEKSIVQNLTQQKFKRELDSLAKSLRKSAKIVIK